MMSQRTEFSRFVKVSAQLLREGRITAKQARRIFTIAAADNSGLANLPIGSEENAREALWNKYFTRRKPVIARMQRVFNRHLDYAKHETLRNIEHAYLKGPGAAIHAANAGDPTDPENLFEPGVNESLAFDLEKWSDGLGLAMRKESATALQTAGDQLFEELQEKGMAGTDDIFRQPSDEVKAFLDRRQNLIKDASQEVWDQIRAAIKEGRDEGETLEELTARVRAEFEGISSSRAETIASTETAAAYGNARHSGLSQAGIEGKEWLCAVMNSRPAHMDAQGQKRPLDEPFQVMGEALMYPGDEAGSAANVINCHCVELAIKLEVA